MIDGLQGQLNTAASKTWGWQTASIQPFFPAAFHIYFLQRFPKQLLRFISLSRTGTKFPGLSANLLQLVRSL